MNDECIICKAPLEYLEKDIEMECAICHKKENSKTRCVKGHYVCNDCHIKGIDTIIGICLNTESKDPVEIIRMMMAEPFCHMHGPEHHVMVGSALLTAYKNAGGDIDLNATLVEMMNRGRSVPGGACGFWGACGAGISTGMFISIITNASPLTKESWGLSNLMTSKALGEIGKIGGPRCCKRDSYLAVLSAVDFVKEHFDIEMEKNKVVCIHSDINNQCIGSRCPFVQRAEKKMIIMHIANREEYESEIKTGHYGKNSLNKYGFIHCSDFDTYYLVAPNFKDDYAEKVILAIDTEKLDCDVKWEDGGGLDFPHIYGLLGKESIVGVYPHIWSNTREWIPNEELKQYAVNGFHRPWNSKI